MPLMAAFKGAIEGDQAQSVAAQQHSFRAFTAAVLKRCVRAMHERVD